MLTRRSSSLELSAFKISAKNFLRAAKSRRTCDDCLLLLLLKFAILNQFLIHLETLATRTFKIVQVNCINCLRPSQVPKTMNPTGINIPPQLSAQDKSSFAYKTIKDRLPVIIVKTIDFFHRRRKDLHKFGQTLANPNDQELTEIEAEAKEVISQLTRLRKDLETNKAAELLQPINNLGDELRYFNDDIELWNKALEANKLSDQSLPRYFDSPWLLVECYLYRKIKEALLKTKHLKLYDPFVEQKQAALASMAAQMSLVAAHLNQVKKDTSENRTHPNERAEFSLFMQSALWANKCDLSISGMSADNIQPHKLASSLRASVESFQENILCDNLSEVWFKMQSIKSSVKDNSEHEARDRETTVSVDLVADNAGYELFVDLCLLDFLGLMLCEGGERAGVKFRLHLKRMPWFVSDALRHDVDYLLGYLSTSEDRQLQELSKRWTTLIESQVWEIYDHRFWTLPNDYSEMNTVSPDLYSTLSESSLIIFKGDLNYRKLTGDRKWHLLTPFKVALRDFQPAPLVALRTAKADVVVGIEDINIFAKINNNELPRDWMISGNFGMIQYNEPM